MLRLVQLKHTGHAYVPAGCRERRNASGKGQKGRTRSKAARHTRAQESPTASRQPRPPIGGCKGPRADEASPRRRRAAASCRAARRARGASSHLVRRGSGRRRATCGPVRHRAINRRRQQRRRDQRRRRRLQKVRGRPAHRRGLHAHVFEAAPPASSQTASRSRYVALASSATLSPSPATRSGGLGVWLRAGGARPAPAPSSSRSPARAMTASCTLDRH